MLRTLAIVLILAALAVQAVAIGGMVHSYREISARDDVAPGELAASIREWVKFSWVGGALAGAGLTLMIVAAIRKRRAAPAAEGPTDGNALASGPPGG